MNRFKRIVATTDLSPESYSAVSYAAHLAKGQGAKLVVLHVPHSVSLAYTGFTPPVSMADIDKTIEDSARKEVESWVKSHLRKLESVKTIVRRGVTHEVICAVAEEVDASVVVMATHGRKGLGHIVLGSVTEAVLRDAPCPVLVVKPPHPTIDVTPRKRSKSTTRVKGTKSASTKKAGRRR